MDTKAFREGFRDGIPIGLGYLAVSFSLGISAKQAGLTPLQGFVTSFLENASGRRIHRIYSDRCRCHIY